MELYYRKFSEGKFSRQLWTNSNFGIGLGILKSSAYMLCLLCKVMCILCMYVLRVSGGYLYLLFSCL
jgi:hypothetical protein